MVDFYVVIWTEKYAYICIIIFKCKDRIYFISQIEKLTFKWKL